MHYILEIRFADQLIETYTFDQSLVTIGRDDTCDVILENLAVSRLHATIERYEGLHLQAETELYHQFYLLKDMNSDNGIYIQEQRIDQYVLNHGTEFFINKYSLTFKCEAKPESPDCALECTTKKDGRITLVVDEQQRLLIQQKRHALVAYLSIPDSSGLKKNLLLNRALFFFGTHPKCDLVINGWRFAKRHVVISRDEIYFRIIHLADTKPPRVNGVEIDIVPLNEGDRIEVADQQMTFHLGKP